MKNFFSSIKNMWAPWRLKYVKESSGNSECVICEKIKAKCDQKEYIIKRGKYCFSFLNIYPYNNGHVMVSPYRHISKFNDLNQGEIQEIMEFVVDLQERIESELNSDGFNVGFNQGKMAGAGIAQHLHLHIVPRWRGDTSFMSVVANTEVIPESLKSVYKKLKG